MTEKPKEKPKPVRRADLNKYVNTESTTNGGLWLDKYLKDDGDEAKKNLVYETVNIQTSKAYRDFYMKWKEGLKSYGAVTKPAETIGRLALNLGAEAVLENSIALNRTYGTPIIPGSALKGLAAHYAKKLKSVGEEQFNVLFGTQEGAGYLNFFDALYIPDSGRLVPDVVTVHHQDYYQGKKPDYLGGKDASPADWDSPIPIHFVTATGRFLLAISGDDAWVTVAYKILGLALEHEGIGAKTNSGYGRMKIIEGKE